MESVTLRAYGGAYTHFSPNDVVLVHHQDSTIRFPFIGDDYDEGVRGDSQEIGQSWKIPNVDFSSKYGTVWHLDRDLFEVDFPLSHVPRLEKRLLDLLQALSFIFTQKNIYDKK